jgi:hypothetical protein
MPRLDAIDAHEATCPCVQLHRAKTFPLSTDPFFIERVRDFVGLYLMARRLTPQIPARQAWRGTLGRT